MSRRPRCSSVTIDFARLGVALVLAAALALAGSGCLADDSGGTNGADVGSDGGDDATAGDVDLDRDAADVGDECRTPDFTCCSGDVEATPVCRAGGRLECPSGFTPAAFGGCMGDVGREVDDADAGDGGACAEGFEHPESETATQTVTFEITNTAETDRFVPEIGFLCSLFAIARDTGDGFDEIPVQFGFDCGCECPFPGVSVVQYSRLVPGDSVTLSWTGRRLVSYSYPFDCADDGWPELGCISRPGGYLVGAEPGDYQVTIPVEQAASLSDDCVIGEQTATCNGAGPGEPGAGPVARLCPYTDVVTAQFALPAEGDVMVYVEAD